MLAYNLATDACDEYFRVRKLTTMEGIKEALQSCERMF
jgi:hypothetical protein